MILTPEDIARLRSEEEERSPDPHFNTSRSAAVFALLDMAEECLRLRATLTLVKKYATEDKARTPGSTRLARSLDSWNAEQGFGERVQRAWVPESNRIAKLEAVALYPPWLADAAEALGEVRPSDGAPLALNWTQIIAAIHELREDRDHWKANSDSWRMVYNAWQDWSTELLHERGLRPADACSHGDGAARDIIADLVRLAPMLPYGAEAIPLCVRCSHKATDHDVDDEERRACLALSCACEQFEAPQ